MKLNNWTLDSLINYLKRIESAPDKLDCYFVPRVRGEIFIENGEPKCSVDKTGSARYNQ